jgi:hypothetical protein
MTTSSSDSSRCTRISPSAVLDDRLDGKDLEWARDHLRRCEACRERVESFREMLLRVGRLPKATVGSAAMDQAFAAAIPERYRDEVGSRSFAIGPSDSGRVISPVPEMPEPIYPEVTSIPDLMSELEREIFHDEPVQDHPTPLTSLAEPIVPAMAEAELDQQIDVPPAVEPPVETEPAESEKSASEAWREVPIDSHRDEPTTWTPDPEPATWMREAEPVAWKPEAEAVEVIREAQAEPEPEVEPAIQAPASENTNVIFDHQPALAFEEPEQPEAPPRRKSDTAMRLAVGLGAAACVLLAAVLYEGGYFLKLTHTLGATLPTAKTAVHTSASTSTSTSARVSPSASPIPTASAPPATVLYTLGDGAGGGSVFRIRPGTAVAGYTRLVFDIHGSGLPSMIVTRPDDLHVQVFFKNTTVTGVPVSGIHSYHVDAVEPGVQQGTEGSFLIDLAHPVRVTAFTLPATGGYAWRLVVDLHTS